MGATAQAHLNDDFARADAAALGNGWIEKSPGAFSIVGGEAAKQSISSWYRDNIVYRPAGEDVLDTEASMEFRVTALPPGYPQLLVRVQSSTVATFDQLDGYILFFENTGTTAVLGRQTAGQYPTSLASLSLSAALNTTDRYRMRLAATGTNPVQLSAYIERRVGNIWQVIGQALYADSAAGRFATAGTVGFSGFVESSYAFDNFARVNIGAAGTPNPAPSTVALAPASASSGESGLTVVVYGNGFTTDSVVRWNGANRPTTYVSPSELEAQISAADLATSGTAAITVANPTPGGGVSAAQTFQINPGSAPAPAITTLAPSAATAGGSAFTLTVTGTGFTANSTVRWNGTNRATTFISATELRANILAADISAPGSANVSVLRGTDNLSSTNTAFAINAGAAGANFSDDFNRANNDALGNGWLEKSPSAFAIATNEAAKVGAGGNDYRNNIAYRPASEDILDVEASVELRLTSTPVGYPQVFVRGQSASIGTNGSLDAYLLYLPDSTNRATLARQRGSAYDISLATINFTSELNTTDRYRLRLRAVGTNPVQLNAFVERFNGTTWDIIGQGTYSDVATDRISTAGSVGFGGYVETSYRYDNFSRSIADAGSSPLPSTTSLSPASATAGSGAQVVSVFGSNFVAASSVRWNGVARTTSFVSSTQLQAQITAADVAAIGTANVTVFSPAPGGGVSNAQVFTISAVATNPVPSISQLNPSSIAAGSSNLTLIVQGSNFVNGSVVRWNGANRTTTFVSSTELRATINAADLSAPGTATVTVFTGTPGGGTSAAANFQINAVGNPAPTITTLSPSTTVTGGPAFTLTVFGSNFVGTSVVRWNGSNRPTSFISSTELRADIAAVDINSQGTRTVSVFSPTPGGGTTANLTFTVTASGPSNPVPTLTQISPQRAQPGSGATVLTVLGTGFNSASVVRWNGQDRPTTLISSTQLSANISGSDMAVASLAAVTVYAPAPGGGTTTPTTFFVQDGSLGLFYDEFNRANNENVGNNWTEKNTNAFFIQDGRLVSRDTPSGFPQDIVVRPVGEDRMDVETSVEFVRLANNPNVLEEANFPQLHARVQRQELMTSYSINSYIFFIEDVASLPGRAMIAINRAPPQSAGLNECYIQGIPLPTGLIEGQRYRLRFRISGTAPVVMTGMVDRFEAGNWVLMASGTATHSASTQRDPALFCEAGFMPPPITDGGAVGVAKWTNRSDLYDNFYWRDLAAGAVAPAIGQLSPQSATAGGAAFTLTVNGSGFTPNSLVRWNGAARTTTYVSTTQLTAAISAADIQNAGSAAITVLAQESGVQSGSVSFPISAPGGTATFTDNFTRADNANLGNGWIEKTASAFSVVSGRAQKLSTPGADYRDNIVFRPANEEALNTEVSIEVRRSNNPVGYPQLLTRLQSATAATPGRFDGYMLHLPDSSTQATLSRQFGFEWDTPLVTFNLSQEVNTTDTFRLRLVATGTNPVNLQAFVERQNGASWVVIGQATYDDASASRIQQPGSAGFGGYVENTYSFDNFTRVTLGN